MFDERLFPGANVTNVPNSAVKGTSTRSLKTVPKAVVPESSRRCSSGSNAAIGLWLEFTDRLKVDARLICVYLHQLGMPRLP
jgi:hypothetical protein